MEIKLQGTDHRGSVYCGMVNGEEKFLVVETKKEKRRGGHYHNIDTFHFVVSGKVTYYELQLDDKGQRIENKNEVKKNVSGGTLIQTPAFAVHMIKALEDSTIIEPLDKNKETIEYAPYRKMI